MTTDTEFHLITKLHDSFHPASMGAISGEEIRQVEDALEVKDRTDIELQNCRDMAVMLYGQWAEHAKASEGLPQMMREMDAMSAVTAVIDQEKARRGLPV